MTPSPKLERQRFGAPDAQGQDAGQLLHRAFVAVHSQIDVTVAETVRSCPVADAGDGDCALHELLTLCGAKWLPEFTPAAGKEPRVPALCSRPDRPGGRKRNARGARYRVPRAWRKDLGRLPR